MIKEEKGWNRGAEPTSHSDHIISVATRCAWCTKDPFNLSGRVSENQRFKSNLPDSIDDVIGDVAVSPRTATVAPSLLLGKSSRFF